MTKKPLSVAQAKLNLARALEREDTLRRKRIVEARDRERRAAELESQKAAIRQKKHLEDAAIGRTIMGAYYAPDGDSYSLVLDDGKTLVFVGAGGDGTTYTDFEVREPVS